MPRVLAVLATATPILFVAAPAEAYVGPGLGLSGIGVLLALVAAVAFSIAGFVWYPVKRMMGGRRKRQQEQQQSG